MASRDTKIVRTNASQRKEVSVDFVKKDLVIDYGKGFNRKSVSTASGSSCAIEISSGVGDSVLERSVDGSSAQEVIITNCLSAVKLLRLVVPGMQDEERLKVLMAEMRKLQEEAGKIASQLEAKHRELEALTGKNQMEQKKESGGLQFLLDKQASVSTGPKEQAKSVATSEATSFLGDEDEEDGEGYGDFMQDMGKDFSTRRVDAVISEKKTWHMRNFMVSMPGEEKFDSELPISSETDSCLQVTKLEPKLDDVYKKVIKTTVQVIDHKAEGVSLTGEASNTVLFDKTPEMEELLLNKVHVAFLWLSKVPDLVVFAVVDGHHPPGKLQATLQLVGPNAEPMGIQSMPNKKVSVTIVKLLRNTGKLLEFKNSDGTVRSDSINKLIDNMMMDRKAALKDCSEWKVDVDTHISEAVQMTREASNMVHFNRTPETEKLLMNHVHMGLMYLMEEPELVVFAVTTGYHPQGKLQATLQIVGPKGEPLGIPSMHRTSDIPIILTKTLRHTGKLLNFRNPDGSYRSDSVNKLIDNMRMDRTLALETHTQTNQI